MFAAGKVYRQEDNVCSICFAVIAEFYEPERFRTSWELNKVRLHLNIFLL